MGLFLDEESPNEVPDDSRVRCSITSVISMDPAVPFILMMIDDDDDFGFRAPQLLDINVYDSNLDLYFSFFCWRMGAPNPK